ncbi:hypothetical protein GGR39_002365 [Novosphingobium fluoreni]|uniref:Helix-turn-helix domain-containing protein n=1 Tax=Novosphingobium fluoreni TaxID=1391222 RepID=A0A7W6C4H8_9SPHN|nr:hypothetical protein [Novosphingobium fluoreni]MBB3940708.1 hypothetical protein [Novosphingobium fluoreni]
MSNHLISEVYKRQCGNMARKAVMVLMADKASDDGSGIWASKQRMADEIGATKQTVIATIKALIADGLLRECGQRKCVNGYTVEYAIVVRVLRGLPLVKSHAEDQSENLTGQDDAPVKTTDPTGQIARPHRSRNLTQTPLEPSNNLKNTQSARAHIMPVDWSPTEFSGGTKCREVIDGWPPGELETQIEHFTSHHRGKGNRFVDWQDAWKTWVLNSRKWNSGNGGNRNSGGARASRSGSQPLDTRDGFERELDERIQRRRAAGG